MANPNPNPKNRFKKGHAPVAGGGRPPGSTNVLTKDIKTLLREAAEEVGFIQRVREHIRAARDAGGRNWCPIFYSAEARRTSKFIGDSTVTGNHLPSGVCEGTAMAETRKLAAFLRRMWSDSASLPGPTRSGHLPASERCEAI